MPELTLALTPDEDQILREAAQVRGITPESYLHQLLTEKMHAEGLLPDSGAPVRPQRIPNLHPGAWTVSDDFDDPLPDEFWLGTE